jgi:signal transduction histidine kinase
VATELLPLRIEPPPAGRGNLLQAFDDFARATTRLEHEYAALSARVSQLMAELEEKNRLLMASAARERRLEAAALRQRRLAAMGEMAAMLAHEVRNPLGAMELFTGLLLQDLQDRPAAHRLAEQVSAGIADLNHLVTNLLEFTRAPSGAPALAAVACDAAIEDALRYTGDLRTANRVVVERRFGPDRVALADPDLLRAVLLNLVRNAVQAMPDGGTLTLTIAAAPEETRIAIADTGAGVPAEAREEIFRPFYTTRPRGTGLGLAVARNLVTAMGGRLELDSEPGRGARFTVILAATTSQGGNA